MMSHKEENQIIYYELFALNDGKMGAYSIDAFFFLLPPGRIGEYVSSQHVGSPYDMVIRIFKPTVSQRSTNE